MNRFLIVLVAFLTFVSAPFMANAYGQSWPAACEGKPPHYLKGFTQTKDQIEAFNQMQLNFEASRSDSSLVGARWAANLGESAQMTFYGHTVTLYLPMYRRADGVVYYHTAAGVTSLTEQEFACVKEDLRDWIQRGIDGDYADHEAINKLAVESFAMQNSMTSDEVRVLLATQIPEYGTNYGDVLKIPQLERADFIKGVKHIYFTSMRSCNAWVAFDTILALSPCVRRMDHILGYPTVVKHELIHANAKLQGFPIGWYSNMELFAALLPFLEQPTDLETFFYHGYLSTPWEMLKVFGRFNVAKIRKEFFRYQVYWGGSALNREVLVNYLAEINKASVWLRESGLKVLGKFYSDPHVWVAVNDMSHDEEMAYRVIVAQLFEPTLLEGHAKTARFILRHTDQSKEIAESAWNRVGKPRSFENEQRAKVFNEYLRLAEALGFSKEELVRIGSAYGMRGKQLEQIDPDMVRQIMNDFLRGEGVFRKKEVLP